MFLFRFLVGPPPESAQFKVGNSSFAFVFLFSIGGASTSPISVPLRGAPPAGPSPRGASTLLCSPFPSLAAEKKAPKWERRWEQEGCSSTWCWSGTCSFTPATSGRISTRSSQPSLWRTWREPAGDCLHLYARWWCLALWWTERSLTTELDGNSGKHGFVVAVTKVESIGKGLIREGTGFVTFPVKYQCVVFRPFRGEILEAVVTLVNKVDGLSSLYSQWKTLIIWLFHFYVRIMLSMTSLYFLVHLPLPVLNIFAGFADGFLCWSGSCQHFCVKPCKCLDCSCLLACYNLTSIFYPELFFVTLHKSGNTCSKVLLFFLWLLMLVRYCSWSLMTWSSSREIYQTIQLQMDR